MPFGKVIEEGGGGVNDHPDWASPIHVASCRKLPDLEGLEIKSRLGIKELNISHVFLLFRIQIIIRESIVVDKKFDFKLLINLHVLDLPVSEGRGCLANRDIDLKRIPGAKPKSTEELPCKWARCTLNPSRSNVLPLVWRGDLERGCRLRCHPHHQTTAEI
ncbi:hypothetical protein AVEN_222342-1 [Araneus ventricosus]|uniref:Uncharacterized protein n=1 Tax=Araneus ventricosus TaxID=182803 RepID=A0A4Y2Q893_ARAVE|nr:hypothetical protein AVEN_242481-1 [Araneus ventricosus]GBN59303.1 hypothetical protein AVEN_116459-1 [Araneus ventricosus]GBN59308.1 hypothetical protein AVEN_119491-1 [Araneus ventricosus]GBN59336.1 hypothetical protein AVEN_222342-1 [Araneus ventricosus]